MKKVKIEPKKHKNVPEEATFNAEYNEWEFGKKDKNGQRRGAWKFWSPTTGYLHCKVFYKDNDNFEYTRFHSDGTYSKKGIYKKGIPYGAEYYQKSENKTSELELKEPLFKKVFSATVVFKKGGAAKDIESGEGAFWKYYNKEGEEINLSGKTMKDCQKEKKYINGKKAFAKVFGERGVPNVLSKLYDFQYFNDGFENYSDGFGVCPYNKIIYLGQYSKSKDFLDKLIPFAQANGSGSFYAIWDHGKTKDLNKMPVVVFGDEGGEFIITENIFQLLQLVSFDSEPMVYMGNNISYYKDKAEYEVSPFLPLYIHWLKENFKLDPINKPDKIVKAAQKKYQKEFDNWMKKYFKESKK